MTNRNYLLVFLFFLFPLLSCSNQNNPLKLKRIKYDDNVAMVVSVSSDGNYAVSSHLNGELVLWDIKNKTRKIITNNANIYSAYFIKNSNQFMWQDDTTDKVFVEDINGKQ